MLSTVSYSLIKNSINSHAQKKNYLNAKTQAVSAVRKILQNVQPEVFWLAIMLNLPVILCLCWKKLKKIE